MTRPTNQPRPTSDARFRTLAERALAKTEAGELDWEETPQEDAFVAILGSGMVKVRRADRLTPSPTDDPDPFYEEVFEVELLTRTAESVLETVFDGFDARGSLGGRLWQAARARARGADDLLDAVLREVDAPADPVPAARTAA